MQVRSWLRIDAVMLLAKNASLMLWNNWQVPTLSTTSFAVTSSDDWMTTGRMSVIVTGQVKHDHDDVDDVLDDDNGDGRSHRNPGPGL
jgi:hypothetical protein